jgi:hypothetical protein
MDASIILQGQSPDIVNALARANDAAQQRLNYDRQNAMNAMLKEQGAGIIAGDQNALNALAQYDPTVALGIQNTRLGMDQTRQQMSVLDEATKRSAEEYARGLSKEQAAAEAAELEGAVKQALMAPTPEAFDAMMTQMGRPEMVGQFENREALAGQFMSVAEILKMNEAPVPLSPEGKLAADIANGVVPTGTTATPDTVINMGEGDKFYEELDKKAAAMFDTLMTEGIQAGRTIGLVDRLDQLLQTTPTGGLAAFTAAAGELGIDIGGLSDVQAAQALINQIVPQQRQPGSGPMSDADLALFKQSVPRLINQPGGNQVIIETMRGINQYVMEQAQIADMVANREITPAEGRKKLRELKNPLDGFKAGAPEKPAKTGVIEQDGYKIEVIE